MSTDNEPQSESPPGEVHVPILTDEILSLLDLRPGDEVIDATVDGGGHATAMLTRILPGGRLLGIDRDPSLREVAERRLAEPITRGEVVIAGGNFRDLGWIARNAGFRKVAAVLFDFGVSSYHFDLSERGFTFAREQPLDMRFEHEGESAADLLADRSHRQLTEIFGFLGEERFAGRIAHSVVRMREQDGPIATTGDLLRAIERALPANVRWQSARSAARVFQALRIAVNDELGAIEAALPQAFELLRPGGRLAALSFHSLEDRLVKRFIAAQRAAGVAETLTKKPICATEEEVAANSRAASAKLRACRKLEA